MRLDTRLVVLPVALLLSLTTPAAPAQPDGDAKAGARKVGSCAGCHGISGWRNAYPAYHVPKLGGQHAEYIVSALGAYRTGQRSHPGMQGIAASLSEQDITDIAAYLARQPVESDP